MAVLQVGGATNNSASGVTTLSVTYSPTNGNTVVLFVNTGGAVTALTVQDSGSHALSAGPVQGNLACFYYTAGAGVTSFTASWTTSQQVGIALEEYSGASVNTSFSSNHASGFSASDTISIPIVVANNWIVSALASANTITGTVGNQRQQITASTARITIVDNTSASIGNVTCTGTLTSASWAAVGLELGGTGKARLNQDLDLAIIKSTGSSARVSQDLELVVARSSTSKARLNQDLSLVINHPNSSKSRLNQEVMLVIYPTPLGVGFTSGTIIGF